MKKTLFLSAILGVALCSNAFATLTVTTAEGSTKVSTGSWTSDAYTSVSQNATPSAAVGATILTTNRQSLKETAAAGNFGDIIVGNNGQIFVETWENKSAVDGVVTFTNDFYIGSSTYDNGQIYGGAMRFGMDSYDVLLTGQLTLVENAKIGGQQKSHSVTFSQAVAQVGSNNTLTLVNNFGTHFNGGMSIGGLTVQSGSKAVTVGTADTVSNMTGSITNAGSGTLTLNGTFNFSGYGTNKDDLSNFSKVTGYFTSDDDVITTKGMTVRKSDTYYAIRNTGSGSINTDNATITGLTKGDDGNYIFTTKEESYTNATYVVLSGSTAEDSDLTGATDLLLAGGSATISHSAPWPAGNGFINGRVSIGGGSTLTLSNKDAFGYKDGVFTQEIIMQGDSSTSRANMVFGSTQTMKSDLTLKGNTTISGSSLNTFGGSISVSGTNNTISSGVQLRENVTVTVAEGAALTLSGNVSKYADEGPGILTKSGDGILSITGTVSGGTINGGDTAKTTISGGISGGTISNATISGAISGGTITDSVYRGNNMTGGTLNNVELAFNQRLNIHGGGHVTLGNVTNHITGSLNGYGIVVYDANTSVTVNGTTDLVTGANGHDKIGLANGNTLTVQAGGHLISGALYNSETSLNGAFTVEAGGQMEVKGKTHIQTLSNAGTTTIQNALNAATITNSGTLTAASLAAADNNHAGNRANVTNSGTLTVAGNAAINTLTITSGSVTLGSATSGINTVVNSGSLSISADAATITDLTLNSDAVVQLQDNHSGTLTTSSLTVNGDSTMNANLVVSAGGTMDFSSSAVLTMGCTVSIGAEGGTVTVVLNAAEIEAIQGGQQLVLIDGVDGDSLEEAITIKGAFLFRDAAGNSLDGLGLALQGVEYSTEHGSYAVVVTPEPATATLSLLALAALAARRRRH